MKAFIDIENDKELRDHAKELLIGQIKSITREEITEIVKAEIRKKIQTTDDRYIGNLVKECMMNVITSILRKEFNINEWDRQYIEPYVTKHLQLALKDKQLNTIIDKIATDKIKAMLNK